MTAPTEIEFTVAGCTSRMLRKGAGAPLLYLHGASGAGVWQPFMEALSEDFDVIVPEHPGFGAAETPDWLDSIHDAAYYYQEFLRDFDLTGVHLVGNSMGGWISCLIAKRMPERIAALVTIAAAPDFTEDGFWSSFSDQQKSEVMDKGITFLPSDYGDPYPITRRLIEDGRNHFILRSPFPVDFPVRMLQGDLDQSVTRETALRLFDHMDGNDIHLSFIKGGDHSLSSPENLKVLENHLETLIAFLE